MIRSRKRPLDYKKILLKRRTEEGMSSSRLGKMGAIPTGAGLSSLVRRSIMSDVELVQERNKNIFLAMTRVLPPEGCPIESHKSLDRLRADGKQWLISLDEWKGGDSSSPHSFGESGSDEGCVAESMLVFVNLSK
jgi:hypothetical protein